MIFVLFAFVNVLKYELTEFTKNELGSLDFCFKYDECFSFFLSFMFFSMYNFSMNISKKVLAERFMIFFAGVVQVVGFAISISVEDFSKAFVPYFNVIVPVLNISCAAVCFFLVVFPKFKFLQAAVLFVQGIAMTLNNIIFLGIFLYCLGIVLLFCYGYLKSGKNVKILVCTGLLIVSLLPILFKDVSAFFMAVAYMMFVLFSYFHLYLVIKTNFIDLFPFLGEKISSMKLPEYGGKLRLSEFGISERQMQLLARYKKGNKKYKDLANCFCISESAVKHEMSKFCKKFGVKNVDSLIALLNLYSVEYA